MSNKGADMFVKGLRASIESWHMTDQAYTFYVAKLSRWNLTDYQWSSLLDKIVETNSKGVLPTIAEIRKVADELRSQQADYGFMYFNIGMRAYAERLVNRDRVWVSLRTGKYFQPPDNATDVLFVPDRQAAHRPEDMPSKDEVRTLVREITENLGRIGHGCCAAIASAALDGRE